MKKISVRKQVIATLAASKAPMTPKEIRAKIKRPSAQVYTALSKMLSVGTVDKIGTGYILLPEDAALPAPKPATVAPPAPSRRELDTAKEEIAGLQHQLRKMSTQYYDAMAVVRYLEAKLISTAVE